MFLAVHNIRQAKRTQGFVHDKNNENLPLKVFTKCDKCGNPLTGYLVKKKGLYYYKCKTKGCKVNRSAKGIHELFRNVLKSFQIGKEEVDIIKVQLEEQMSVFFKSQMENSISLKAKLTETRKKLNAIEERFVIGEIDRDLYEKFRPKYQKECFEIEQELNKTGGYSSNLKKVIDFAVKICRNPFLLWDYSDLNDKRLFQNLLFPEGIYYNRELDVVRTPRINTFFSPIPEMARVLNGHKKRDSIKIDKIPSWVNPAGLEPTTS